MNDSKIERQLNLFFLLLNSNRPIGRQEIKNKIIDYKKNESEKAFERMFERDKDDLRKNGIRINTVNIDSLFDDEIGYQLDKETFITKNIILDDEEKLILKHALNLWNETTINSDANNIFKKIGVSNPDFIDLVQFKIDPDQLDIHQKLLKAIISRNEISIFYISAHQDEPDWRRLHPLQVFYESKELFLKAFDIASSKIKTYKILNILALEVTDESFSIPQVKNELDILTNTAQIRIKNGTDYYTNILKGRKIADDLIEIPIYNYVATARFLLPFIQVVDEILDKKLQETLVLELNKIYEAISG